MERRLERRLLLSTVALALVAGTVAASGETRRPADRDRVAPQATAPQNEPRGNPPSGAAAPNAPTPQAQQNTPAPQNMQNARQPARGATTGEAPAQTPPNRSNAGNQALPPATGQTQPQQPAMPEGQARRQPQGQAQGQGPAQPGTTQGTTAGTNGAAADTNAQQNSNANAATQGGTAGVITLNEQQNALVAQGIRQANVRPIANPSFSIAIGTTIPDDVQLATLPPALAEIVPQYRGFSFVVVEQEALIIDPGTRAIVAVMPFEAQQTTGANRAAAPPPAAPAQAAAPPPGPTQSASPPPRERRKTDVTREQREMPRRQVERHRKHETSEKKSVTTEEHRTTSGTGYREPRVGDRVPDSAVIEGRPVEVYRDPPPVRSERPHPSVRDIPLIGPLFGPPDQD